MHRKVLRSLDEPYSPCSCVLLQAYSPVFDLGNPNDEQEDEQILVSRDPYICISCWHAYRKGEADRMIYPGLDGGKMKLNRTYFDFQDRPLLTVTMECDSNAEGINKESPLMRENNVV